MSVLSVQKHTLTITSGNSEATATLTGSPTTSNCVPFVTTRISSASTNNSDAFEEYAVSVDFPTGTSVRARTTDSPSDPTGPLPRALVCEVTVVEFDPAVVNVYQGTASTNNTNDTATVNDAFGAGPVTVNLAKAWMTFGWTSVDSSEWWRNNQIRGRITSTSQLTFDCSANASVIDIDWYVVECQGTEWSVSTQTLQMLAAETSDSVTSLGLTANKTMVLGSFIGADASADADSNAQNTIDVNLSADGNTLSCSRVTASGQIDWSGFLVTFSGNEMVYRNTLTWSVSEASKTDVSITGGPVADTADCLVHLAGHTGSLGGGKFSGTTSTDVVDAFTAWTFTNASNLTVTHNTAGGETGQVLSWEVIEWDVSGAAQPGRVLWR